MKRPSFQFYPADWRSDSSLQVCSLRARGLWLEILCLLHELGQQEGSRYGYLELRGNPLNPSHLSRLVGVELQTVSDLLEELEVAGVFSRDQGGVIYSRRFARDGQVKQIRSKAGSKGGSKTQANFKQTSSKPSSKPSSKTQANHQANFKHLSRVGPYAGARPEVEVEVEEEEEKVRVQGKEKQNPRELVELFHELCPSLPRVLQISGHRKKAIKARARDFETQDSKKHGLSFRKLFEMAEASDFLTGRTEDNGRGFRADLSWLLNPENATKTLEGKYENRTKTNKPDRDYANAFILAK